MNEHIWWIVLATTVAISAVALLVRVSRQRVDGLAPDVKVIYTKHAKDRMVQRKVAATEIESVLANPKRQTPDPAQGSIRLERDFGDHTLKVWVVAPWPARDEVIIKSTAWIHRSVFTVPSACLPRIIGRGGATINEIREQNGAHIAVLGDGTIRVRADDREAVEAVKQQILAIANQRHPTHPPRAAA